ncbi:MAG TPA: outer membrane beta-barrel protein [Pyrinomonadaceae bacterium]|nr:outer membrane beta-barrel protein [Pyrinomonadaceae bacterium]
MILDFHKRAICMAATFSLLAIVFSTTHAQQAIPNGETSNVFSSDKDSLVAGVTPKTAGSEAKQDPSPSPSASPETAPSESPRRAQPAPFDGVFPGTEYLGPVIGVPDTDPVWPLTKALWDASPALKKAKIKAYGWFNPGFTVSTSNNSNQPLSYAIVPNKLEMDQAVLRFERVPDTAQTNHVDWGFRFTTFYGIDYRWTTAQGWFSDQLLGRNSLYGADPVEVYGLIYFPKVAKGMVLKFGRYISPPDIEAQLAPDNYLFTHSLMFDYDAYTNTGIQASIMLNKQWSIQLGFHAGKDAAPWAKGAHPSAQAMVRWVSKSNNDSIYGGIANLNNGKFKGNFDNSQQFNVTWSHRFNQKGTILTMTEAYYLYQRDALVGGSVISGPPRSFFTNVGAGAFLPGLSHTGGIVNYTAFKLSNKDFITLRLLDFIFDGRGQRSGFDTTLGSWTAGWTHRFSDLISIRPEFRHERSFARGVTPYDNGTRKTQTVFAMDAIFRF